MQELQYPMLFLILQVLYWKVLSDMKSTCGKHNSLFTPCGATCLYQTEILCYNFSQRDIFCVPYFCDVTTEYLGGTTYGVVLRSSVPCCGSISFLHAYAFFSYVSAWNTSRNFGDWELIWKTHRVPLPMSINFAILFWTVVRQHRTHIIDHDNH